MRILTSHRMEDLLDALCEQLQADALPPLETETIVVPGLGLARWLELRLAERLGIAAGIELPLLGAYLHRLTNRDDDAADSVRARRADVAHLAAARRAPRPRTTRRSARPATTCATTPTARSALQLCTRLAGCFDEYQLYRDELLLGFARGEDHKALSPHAPWQARAVARAARRRRLCRC